MTIGEDVLGVAAAEVTRQEARVDAKAGQVATLAGTLATLAVSAAAAVSTFATPMPKQWELLAIAPLAIAGALWAAAVVVLLRRTIRPDLNGDRRGSFVNPDPVRELQGMTVVEYQQALVSRLSDLVLRRYRAVRLAVDLLIAGFIPLLMSGMTAAALAVA